MIVSRENSPYTENSSPFQSATKASPRNFWSTRENMSPTRFDENTPERSPSPSLISPKRRSSIEKLKQASRVKNSNIYTLESKDAYDPMSLPIVERPSANRPLSQQLANNSFTRFDSLRKENNPMRSPQRPGHKRSETEIHIPVMSPTKEYAMNMPLPASPEKQASPSPTKSSLSRLSQFGVPSPSTFDPETCAWSDEERAPTPKSHVRHNKSVTFNAEPPEVTEYEQQTPEPSVSVGSREGSWDTDEYEDADVSFDRGSSADVGDRHDDSFDDDLEDTDKTPVVLPEDWRHMSPDEARRELVNDNDDVFDEQESTQRPVLGRSESVASDGESRPLPPLPGFMTAAKRRESESLTMAAERAANAARNLPSPPKRATEQTSSLSLQEQWAQMGGSTDRPTSSSTDATAHGPAEELVVTNLDTGEKMDVQVRVAEAEVADDDSIIADLADFANAPPRISRESILRKVRGTKYDFDDEEEDEELDEGRPTYEELARVDPDHAIPSRENSRETNQNQLPARHSSPFDLHVDDEEEVKIKSEPVDDEEVDMAAIPAAHPANLLLPRSPTRMEEYERQSSVLRHNLRSESTEGDQDDSESRYSASMEPEAESTMLHPAQPEDEGKETLQDAMELLTVKDYSSTIEAPAVRSAPVVDFMSSGLPTYLSTNDYDFGMSQYITPSPPATAESMKDPMLTAPVLQPPVDLQRVLNLPRASFTTEAEISPPGTPGSVVHRSSDVSSLQQEELEQLEQPIRAPSPPAIPERTATIKTGGKLKARPAGTPADFEMMRQQRRMISGEHPVPTIPDAYRGIDASVPEDVDDTSVYSSDSKTEPEQPAAKAENRRQSKRHMALNLDIPAFGSDAPEDSLAMGLETEFDRVIENQNVSGPFPPPLFARFQPQNKHIYPSSSSSSHADSAESYAPTTPYTPDAYVNPANISPRFPKGYLMRPNTKVVGASNRTFSSESEGTATAPVRRAGSRSANSSPRKPSAEQFLKTEPWNGQTRRKSVRNASAQRPEGPAPPLPGKESALGVVDEDYAAGSGSLEDDVAEGVERGRLFVKVVGVKDLDLPMPKNDRVYFQLTLDNGLHCVTTTQLELGKNAPIGQEFELVVLNDLEFQLTLTTKLPPAPVVPPTPAPSSPTKSLKSPSKTSSFASRFLSSPRKRAERERQDREAHEEEQRRQHQAAERKRASTQPLNTTWDLLHTLVNPADGAFARAYINLKAHEPQCFGRHLSVDVPCYNEWALERDAQVVNSVRSKRGGGAPVRKPPYVVGQLQLQLLYVPKPRGAGDEDLPKSMGSAVREMARACEVVEVVREGCLSQQGGDCAVSSIACFSILCCGMLRLMM